MTVRTAAPGTATARPTWRTVAIPSEHGGWGLTGEPILLGLLLAFSWPGLAIGLAAMLAFLARTPLKLAMVDRRRDRELERSALARRIGGAELVAIAALGASALLGAGGQWLVPVAVALPLFAVELWFDVRSRGRRLVPELCGAVGMGAVAAAIVIAGDGSVRLGGRGVADPGGSVDRGDPVHPDPDRPAAPWLGEHSIERSVPAAGADDRGSRDGHRSRRARRIDRRRGNQRPAPPVGASLAGAAGESPGSSADGARLRPRGRYSDRSWTGMNTIGIEMTLGAIVTTTLPRWLANSNGASSTTAAAETVTLGQACRDAGLDAVVVAAELTSSIGDDGPASWSQLDVADLVDTSGRDPPPIPVGRAAAPAGAARQGRRRPRRPAPELHEIARCFRAIRADIEPHLVKEERVLFPAIGQLATSSTAPTFGFGSIGSPISAMLCDHDEFGALLRQLRASTSDFTVPDDGCASYTRAVRGARTARGRHSPARSQGEQRAVPTGRRCSRSVAARDRPPAVTRRRRRRRSGRVRRGSPRA